MNFVFQIESGKGFFSSQHFFICLQVSVENTIQQAALRPFNATGIPNSLGLHLEAESRHFEGGGGFVNIKCLAQVGSKTYDTEKRVLMAHVNNQRLSAGDLYHSGRSKNTASYKLNHSDILLTIFIILFVTT